MTIHIMNPQHPPQSANAHPPMPPPVDLGSISRRLRMLEELVDNIRRKSHIDQRSIIEDRRKQNNMIQAFGEELDELKINITDIRNDVRLIIKELQLTAKNEQLQTLTKYIDLWNPVRFTTVNQVERIVLDMFRKYGIEQKAFNRQQSNNTYAPSTNQTNT